MAGFLASAVEIGLSAALPVAVAIAIFFVEARGPLAPYISASRGIVAPYFASVSILFGLFAALLVSDVWQKANAANHAVQVESDTVLVLAHLARANGVDALVIPRLKAYATAASAEDPYSTGIAGTRNETGKAYLELLTTVSQASGLDGPGRTAMLAATRELLRAHDDRLNLANDFTAPIKWFAILVFGTITQIALLLVHVDNRRAMRVAVGLFTVAFSFCLVIVAIFDAPFEIVLAGEPRASLKLALDGL